jgi:hypothetical protein
MWSLRKTSLLVLLAGLTVSAAVAQSVTTGDDMYLKMREVGSKLRCQCEGPGGCSYTVADCNMLRCRRLLEPACPSPVRAWRSVSVLAQGMGRVRWMERGERQVWAGPMSRIRQATELHSKTSSALSVLGFRVSIR